MRYVLQQEYQTKAKKDTCRNLDYRRKPHASTLPHSMGKMNALRYYFFVIFWKIVSLSSFFVQKNQS
jgi:hypothetical protein